MKKYLVIATVLAGVGSAGMAFGGDDDCRVPMADWQPREAVQKMAEGRGWTVRRLKTDDGCYEIKGRDAEGREIEVKIDPATLAIVEMEYEDDDCRVPAADWQPREAVRKMAEAQGWTVRRIETDDGCYEIKGRDAEGRRIKVKVDPATLAIVERKLDDDDDNRGRSLNRAPAEAGRTPADGRSVPGGKPAVE